MDHRRDEARPSRTDGDPLLPSPLDLPAARRALPEAAAHRIADPNVTDAERRAVEQLLTRETGRTGD